MTTKEIKERCRRLLNNTYLYRGNKITITSFSEDNGTYCFETSEGKILKYESEVFLFIELMGNNIVSETQIIKPDTLVAKVIESNQSLFDVIDRMVKKVESDPSFVPQANAVNDLLKTKIEATKTAIMASKL